MMFGDVFDIVVVFFIKNIRLKEYIVKRIFDIFIEFLDIFFIEYLVFLI